MASSETDTVIAGHRLTRADLALLFTLGLGVFAGALDLGVLSPALPALGVQFDAGASSLAWIFTAYLLANVVSIPITSKLSDVYGRRPVYIACVAVFAAGSALAIGAPSFPTFLAARIVQAIGAGGIFPVATAAIADRTAVERRGAALGILGAIWGLAAIIGPNVGGMATHFFGWRAIFALNIPLAIVVIALARRHVPARSERHRGPLDLAGIALLCAGLLATMAALTALDPGTHVLGGASPPVLGALALMAFAALVPVEQRAAEPIISPRLVRNRQILVTYGLEIGIGILEGALFFIPAALVAADHVTYAAAGAIASIGAVMFVAVIPAAGRAIDRVGSRAVLAAGAACSAVGLALFASSLEHVWSAAGAIALTGIGFGSLLGAPTRYIISNEAPETMRATAIGLLSIFLIVGQIIGGSLAGGIIGTSVANVGAFARAYWTFCAIAACVACATSLLRGTKREATSQQRTGYTNVT